MSEPITRVEMYLAALNGESVTLPAPITRIDKYLYALCQTGIGGGATDEQIAAAVAAYLKENPVESGNNSPLVKYVHSSNREIHPTALDLTTGVFTLEAHGIDDGQACVVVPDGSWVTMPFELWSVATISTNTLKIHVIDENTFCLQYSGTDLTFANTNNTASVDISKWHIELGGPYNITLDGFSVDAVRVYVEGWVGHSSNYTPALIAIDEDGNDIPLRHNSENFGYKRILEEGTNLGAVPSYLVAECVYGKHVRIKSFHIAPTQNEADYIYFQTNGGIVSADNRCAAGAIDRMDVLAEHGKISAIRFQGSGNKAHVSMIPVNGFTIEVYDNG